MNDLRTAAQQALEALEQYTAKELTVGQRYTNEGQRLLDAITDLRAALAQQAKGGGNLPPPLQAEPVEEPVAEVFVRRDGVSFAFWLKAPPPERTKLYTAPPQRTMVPLTEEEIYKIFKHLCNTVGAPSYKTMARAVEKASWEKNHG